MGALKPGVKTLQSPRQTLATTYHKLRRGASSLRQAVTPRTTPGITPRETVPAEGSGEHLTLASNAIKEADNPACMDVDEAKSQAVSGTMHTGMGGRVEKGKEGAEAEEELEMLNKDQPTPKQLRAIFLLMKVNAATNPQQTMRWLHDLEWLLVSLDPLERQQPVCPSPAAPAYVAGNERKGLSSPSGLLLCLSPIACVPCS